MERLKKFCYTYKTLIFISVLVFVLILCFLIMRKPAKLYNFLYMGNNIRLDLNLNINGELINTRDMSITCMESDEKKKVKIKKRVITAKGRDKGNYQFYVTVPKEKIKNVDEDIQILLNYSNLADSTISDHKIDIQMQAERNKVKGTYHVYTSVYGRKDYQIAGDIEFEGPLAKIFFGG